MFLEKETNLELQASAFTARPQLFGRSRGGEMIEDNFIDYKFSGENGERYSNFDNQISSEQALNLQQSDLKTSNDISQNNVEWQTFSVSIFPVLQFRNDNVDYVKFSLGLFWAENVNIGNLQISLFGNTVTETLNGVQIAGFMNTVNLKSEGVQVSGFLNNVKNHFTGVQVAGFLNTTSLGFNGVQTSGFMNTAGEESEGVQVAGFINIANSINGLQLGFINIAKSNTGIALGVFNFIADGLISPGFSMDSNGVCYLQYQGGKNSLYTSVFVGCPTNWGKDWDFNFLTTGLGIGTRFSILKLFSLDLELYQKNIVNFEGITELFNITEKRVIDEITNEEYFDKAKESYEKQFKGNFIPMLRVTTNFHLLKHLCIFASCDLNFNIGELNSNAFNYGTYHKPIPIFNENFQIYPAFSFGIKF